MPLDGSSFAEQALPFALSAARRATARLQVVVVIPTPEIPFVVSTQFLSHLAGRWSGYLERIVEPIQGSYAGPVGCQVLEGAAVAPTICAHAEHAGVDLVVMTTHGRGSLGRWWFGSVAYEILRSLSMPALFVRPGDDATEWGKEPALQHVLVTLDGSLQAERVLEPAVTLGTLMNANYTLLSAIDDIPVGVPELDSVSLSSSALGQHQGGGVQSLWLIGDVEPRELAPIHLGLRRGESRRGGRAAVVAAASALARSGARTCTSRRSRTPGAAILAAPGRWRAAPGHGRWPGGR